MQTFSVKEMPIGVNWRNVAANSGYGLMRRRGGRGSGWADGAGKFAFCELLCGGIDGETDDSGDGVLGDDGPVFIALSFGNPSVHFLSDGGDYS